MAFSKKRHVLSRGHVNLPRARRPRGQGVGLGSRRLTVRWPPRADQWCGEQDSLIQKPSPSALTAAAFPLPGLLQTVTLTSLFSQQPKFTDKQ